MCRCKHRRAFGLRPVPVSPSRPFGVNPSRLRAGGAARCVCTESTPHQKAARVTLRQGLLRQVARKRAVLDADSSLSGHHEGRFTDMLPSLLMELVHHAFNAAPQSTAGAFAPIIRGLDLVHVRTHTGKTVMRRNRVCHLSLQDDRPVRPCLVVNPGGGRLRLGLIGRNRPAQTISPPPGPASSRDKFFVLPGPPRCYGRSRGAASPPPPTGSQQGRTGATLIH